MNNRNKPYPFTKTHTNLTQVLTDHRLASLGDTYTNFTYSLAQSNRRGEPTGTKVKGQTLAQALKKAGLREHLPSRMTRHAMADAAEALIVYAWLHNHITLEETVTTLEKTDNPTDGFSHLLTTIKKRVKFS
jgi:hypothetical protein